MPMLPDADPCSSMSVRVDTTRCATARTQPMLLSAMALTEISSSTIIKPIEGSMKSGARLSTISDLCTCIGTGTRD